MRIQQARDAIPFYSITGHMSEPKIYRRNSRESAMEFEKRISSDVDAPELSVVVLTYNSCHDLSLCLASFQSQTIDLGKVQIVIVDDGSTDATSEVVETFRGLLNIDYFVLKHTGSRGGNRNFGVSKVKAEIMLLLDGDMILSKDFLEKHIANTRFSKDTISMGKRRRPYKADESKITPAWIRDSFIALEGLPCLDDERLIFELAMKSLNLDPGGIFAMVFSHNICLWKERFDEIGGFDEAFSKLWGTEDVELGYRLVKAGCKVKLDGEIVGYHLSKDEDLQRKVLQLRKNLGVLRRKHQDWEAELASAEHNIYAFRYLCLREQILAKKHVVRLLDAGKALQSRKVFFGVEHDGVERKPDGGLHAPSWGRLGLYSHELDGDFDEAFVSDRYRELGEEFFDRVMSTAFNAAKIVSIVSPGGTVIRSIPRLPGIRAPKKLIICLSDYAFGGNNKVYFYRLGMALSRRGVKVGFTLSSDLLENRQKFSAFGDIETSDERKAIAGLYHHDLFLNEDIHNLSDDPQSAGIGRSIGRRIHWQENSVNGSRQAIGDYEKRFYSRFFARRSNDLALSQVAEGTVPVGVCARTLRRVHAHLGERIPGNPITILWICQEMSDISGFGAVLEAFAAVKRKFKNISLKAIIGAGIYTDKPEYLNDSAWHLVKKIDRIKIENERKLRDSAFAAIDDKANISILHGTFGNEFLTQEILKSDILLDTFPGRLLLPWVLDAYAAGKKIIRFDDGDYADYLAPGKTYGIEYELISGIFGAVQFEQLAHGVLSRSRYLLYKKAKPESLEKEIARAVSDCHEQQFRSNLNEEFLMTHDWDKIAEKFEEFL